MRLFVLSKKKAARALATVFLFSSFSAHAQFGSLNKLKDRLEQATQGVKPATPAAPTIPQAPQAGQAPQTPQAVLEAAPAALPAAVPVAVPAAAPAATTQADPLNPRQREQAEGFFVLQQYAQQKMGAAFQSCQSSAQQTYKKVAAELQSQADKASTKTEQTRYQQSANVVGGGSELFARGNCLVRVWGELNEASGQSYFGPLYSETANYAKKDELTQAGISKIAQSIGRASQDYLDNKIMATLTPQEERRLGWSVGTSAQAAQLRYKRWEESIQIIASYLELDPKFGCTLLSKDPYKATCK
jgi:hypothetical protein